MSVLLSGVQLRQRFAKQPSGFVAIRVPSQQHALGERELSPFCRGSTCRWMWDTDWKAALPSLMTRCCRRREAPTAGGPGDALTDVDQAHDRVRRRVGQVDRVALRELPGCGHG